MLQRLAYRVFAGLIIVLPAALFASAEKALEQQTLPSVNFFYSKHTLSNKNMHQQGDEIAQKTAYAIATKTGTVLNGPFTYIFENVHSFDPQALTAQIGWPVAAATQASGNYQFRQTSPFRCVTSVHEGPHTELPHAWKKLVTQAMAEGYNITGEGRTLIKLSGANGYVVAELQLGVR